MFVLESAVYRAADDWGALVPCGKQAMVNALGRAIGQHEGHQHFTIGQRKGVGVALGHPVYVVSKDVTANTITVGDREDLQVGGVTARDTNWLFDLPVDDDEWISCTVKFRYNSPPEDAEVRRSADDELQVRFAEPQYGVAPGQAVVCYDGDAVMCGGWIATTTCSRLE